MTAHILIVDDDPAIREVVRFALEDAGLRVSESADGTTALRVIAQESIDLVILDIGMPGLDGFQTCRAIREKTALPVIFLTARDDEIDRVLAFELGGDDHVSKPFSPRELVLRVRAILRRQAGGGDTAESVTHGDLVMVPERHHCTLGGEPVALTGVEFSLLLALLRAPGRVRSRSALADLVWGAGSQVAGRTIDSHLRNIRQKARGAGSETVIETVHGVGVKLGPCTRQA
ncbi:MAG: response regulator transcription factor [Pseudomonadota bacterium]